MQTRLHYFTTFKATTTTTALAIPPQVDEPREWYIPSEKDNKLFMISENYDKYVEREWSIRKL